MTDDTRSRQTFRRRTLGTYTFFAKLPAILKVMAYLTLALGGFTVLMPLYLGVLRHPLILVQVLFTVVSCILAFFMFMGFSEWAKVALDTHVNVLLLDQRVKGPGAVGQPPQGDGQ